MVSQALLLETTFLIDYERERHAAGDGPAHAFLRAHPNALLYIDHTVAGELCCGKTLTDRIAWEKFIRPFKILPRTPDVDWEYGNAFRFLQDNGMLIDTNDLWIAATALAFEVTVITRNIEHYRRIPRLQFVTY